MWVQLFVEGAQQLVKLKCLLQFEEKMFSCVDHQERERERGSGEKRWGVVDDDMVDRVVLSILSRHETWHIKKNLGAPWGKS